MTTGILSCGAYIPRKRLQRLAIYAANAWFAGGLRGLAKGERARLALPRRRPLALKPRPSNPDNGRRHANPERSAA